MGLSILVNGCGPIDEGIDNILKANPNPDVVTVDGPFEASDLGINSLEIGYTKVADTKVKFEGEVQFNPDLIGPWNRIIEIDLEDWGSPIPTGRKTPDNNDVIYDGDSIRHISLWITPNNKESLAPATEELIGIYKQDFEIRLRGFDAPEITNDKLSGAGLDKLCKDQINEIGRQSRERLREELERPGALLVLKRIMNEEDAYGRLLAVGYIRIPGKKDVAIADLLINEDLAVRYTEGTSAPKRKQIQADTWCEIEDTSDQTDDDAPLEGDTSDENGPVVVVDESDRPTEGDDVPPVDTSDQTDENSDRPQE